MLFQLLHNLLGKAADAVIQLAPDRPGRNLRIVAQHTDIVGVLIHRADAQQRQKAVKLLIILDAVEIRSYTACARLSSSGMHRKKSSPPKYPAI